jgi:drug/metabolite transporter (DMT)-like permease
MPNVMSVRVATILGSNAPIFAFLLALLFVRHERPTLRQSFGVAAGLTGICLVVGVDALNGLGQDVMAQLALVLSAVMFGAAALFGRNFNGLDSMVPAAGSMICGAIILIPLSLVIDRPWTLTPSTASIVALIALAVFSTALAFVIYFRLIQTLGSVGATAQVPARSARCRSWCGVSRRNTRQQSGSGWFSSWSGLPR